jgi:dTDP-4-amino-4,6-dideoxygalactose transaminase
LCTTTELNYSGVDNSPVFYPLPAMPPYYSENWRQKFPVALWVAELGFSLPSSVDLDEKATFRIAECLNELVATEEKRPIDEAQGHIQ